MVPTHRSDPGVLLSFFPGKNLFHSDRRLGQLVGGNFERLIPHQHGLSQTSCSLVGRYRRIRVGEILNPARRTRVPHGRTSPPQRPLPSVQNTATAPHRLREFLLRPMRREKAGLDELNFRPIRGHGGDRLALPRETRLRQPGVLQALVWGRGSTTCSNNRMIWFRRCRPR